MNSQCSGGGGGGGGGGRHQIKSGENLQFPGAVTQLGTSLADVNMANLEDQTRQKNLSKDY